MSWFAFQSFVNIGMTLGIMPVTGLPLPFVSYGGSSMFANMIAVGLLRNVHMRSRNGTDASLASSRLGAGSTNCRRSGPVGRDRAGLRLSRHESLFPRLEPLLPRVQKPIQYVGGELNAQVKDWDDAEVRWALMYPDAYEVGLPNQGVMILYEVLNEHRRRARRAHLLRVARPRRR